jgi:hypothetical protein
MLQPIHDLKVCWVPHRWFDCSIEQDLYSKKNKYSIYQLFDA